MKLSNVNNLTKLNNLKKLKTEEQTETKANRGKKITMIKVGINGIEILKIIENIKKTTKLLCENEQIDKPLTRLTRKKRERTQI